MLSWTIMVKKSNFSLLNGSEPSYKNKKWNDNLKIKKLITVMRIC